MYVGTLKKEFLLVRSRLLLLPYSKRVESDNLFIVTDVPTKFIS